jgi:hypothetical protein
MKKHSLEYFCLLYADQEKYGVLFDDDLKDEETILEGYRQEKFRIQQRLESLEAKAKVLST